MFSSLQASIDWVAEEFGIPVSTYPQSGAQMPFAVVNRTGGVCAYPHDYPRITVQFWTGSDADGESIAFACAIAMRDGILQASESVNAVGDPEITQLGHIDGGGFVWQVSAELATNIQ